MSDHSPVPDQDNLFSIEESHHEVQSASPQGIQHHGSNGSPVGRADEQSGDDRNMERGYTEDNEEILARFHYEQLESGNPRYNYEEHEQRARSESQDELDHRQRGIFDNEPAQHRGSISPPQDVGILDNEPAQHRGSISPQQEVGIFDNEPAQLRGSISHQQDVGNAGRNNRRHDGFLAMTGRSILQGREFPTVPESPLSPAPESPNTVPPPTTMKVQKKPGAATKKPGAAAKKPGAAARPSRSTLLAPPPRPAAEPEKTRKKPGPPKTTVPPIKKDDLKAKNALIKEIEGHWGVDFIKNYIPKVHRPLTKRKKGKARTHNRKAEDNPIKWLPSILKCILNVAKKIDDKVRLKKLMGDIVRYRNQHTGNKKPQLVTTDFDIIEDILDRGWSVAQSFDVRYKHLLSNKLADAPTDTPEQHEYYENLFRTDSEDSGSDGNVEGNQGFDEDDGMEFDLQNDLSNDYQMHSGYYEPPPPPPQNPYQQAPHSSRGGYGRPPATPMHHAMPPRTPNPYAAGRVNDPRMTNPRMSPQGYQHHGEMGYPPMETYSRPVYQGPGNGYAGDGYATPSHHSSSAPQDRERDRARHRDEYDVRHRRNELGAPEIHDPIRERGRDRQEDPGRGRHGDRNQPIRNHSLTRVDPRSLRRSRSPVDPRAEYRNDRDYPRRDHAFYSSTPDVPVSQVRGGGPRSGRVPSVQERRPSPAAQRDVSPPAYIKVEREPSAEPQGIPSSEFRSSGHQDRVYDMSAPAAGARRGGAMDNLNDRHGNGRFNGLNSGFSNGPPSNGFPSGHFNGTPSGNDVGNPDDADNMEMDSEDEARAEIELAEATARAAAAKLKAISARKRRSAVNAAGSAKNPMSLE